MKNIEISVVVPVYKESEIIEDFYQQLINVMEKIKINFEIIFINDDNPDSETMQVLKKIHSHDERVKVISFTRNFGHQIALTAGIDYAEGEAVIMLDSDLQHPPDLIPTLIDYWKKGYDIVYTVRQDVLGENFLKKFFSKSFYLVMSKIANIDMGFNCADFRLLSRKAAGGFRKIKENTRFVRGLVSWIGYRRIGVPFVAKERHKGKSKYSVRKNIGFALDAILSFSNFPIRIISFTGILISSVSFIYIIRVIFYLTVEKGVIPDWLPITTIILFLSGIQLLMLGIVGEYVAKIYSETKNRPLYLIDEIYDNAGGGKHEYSVKI